MPVIRNAVFVIVFCLLALLAIPAHTADQDETEVLALADLALQRITEEDFVGLTDLMIDSAVAYATSVRDGGYSVQSRSYTEQRESVVEADFVERGFAPTVLVSGTVAMVWYPYDFYSDGEWSHCGVDIFNMVRTNDGWRIANMAWSADQPPICNPHPDGPPVAPTE